VRERPPSAVVIRGFAGMALDADPQDHPEGLAVAQVNVESKERGSLKSRRGYRKTNFES
jgi:hypothetical protein